MKNLQMNEKHLADKLQNVPVPDVDQSWEQMRRLLDRDMPEPAAGAWSGNRKWWWMGITAGIIMLAAWLAQPFNRPQGMLADKHASEKNAPVINTHPASEPAAAKTSKKAATDNADNNNAELNNSSSNTTIASTSPKPNTNKNIPANTDKSIDKSSSHINDKTDKKTAVAGNNIAKDYIRKAPANRTELVKNTSIKNKQEKTLRGPGSDIVNSLSKNNELVNNNIQKLKTRTDLMADQKLITGQKTASSENLNKTTSEISDEIESSPINTTYITEERSFTPADAFSTIESRLPAHLAVMGKTDRAFARELRKKSMKDDNRRISKSSMNGKSGDKDHDITFAAGLALPQSFAISGQQSSSYNINAGSSRITDYLPAPFFQYHVNDKLFLQTEFHFQSPQYTNRLLLSSNVAMVGNRKSESNVHLEKLYYFNIPFNVYYSPARNFYIGGGLQYSSLLSGVASFEEKSSEGQTVLSYNSVTRRFKDDSVAAVFAPSEWRYQFDANYYFNRFTLGMRFNQAMKDFINIQPGVNMPQVIDRNRSFLLYLRFNIWEERKK